MQRDFLAIFSLRPSIDLRLCRLPFGKPEAFRTGGGTAATQLKANQLIEDENSLHHPSRMLQG